MNENQNIPPEDDQSRPPLGPTHSPRTWRACCLTPMIALMAILIFVVFANLANRQRRGGDDSSTGQRTTITKQEFMSFGNEYFEIAQRADQYSLTAFQELDAMQKGNGSVGRMQSAFRDAAVANGRASEQFKGLDVPVSLRSKERIRRSLDTMSQSYDMRRQACETMAAWNGDRNDQSTRGRYMDQSAEIRRLTEAGLRDLVEAAQDNGLSMEDLHNLTQTAETMRFWEKQELFGIGREQR